MVEMLSLEIGEQVQRSRQALITFLSLLELGKLGYVSLYQTDVYGDIHIQTKKEIEDDVLSRVEEYGHINNNEVAEKLFAKMTDESAEDTADQSEMTAIDSADEDTAIDTMEMATDEEILALELELENDREPEQSA
jgi:segregation and condensation protein A